MPSSPKNYPFYNWVPKPVGIIILFVFFLPILTVGGTYSVASTEMMSGLGIISEHIQFANFATSQLYLCQDRQCFPAGTMQHLYGIPTNGTDDGQPLHPHKVCRAYRSVR